MQPQLRYRPGNKIGGRYQVHQALMGGMGEVYLCLDLETNLPFALKTFQHRYLTNAKLRQAFENEVATWVALENHPNIVRCFYLKVLNNQPFMFLEWIVGKDTRGADLRSWLRRGPLDLRLALDFIIDVCRGLIHAHQKQSGIVHCDLKPANILIAQGQVAKVTDFGLARVVQTAKLEAITGTKDEVSWRQSLFSHNGVVGTPPYMAPEQWRGEQLDVRTDIYAIGCILYELLKGYWPFRGPTIDSFRRQHLETDIFALKEHRSLPNSVNSLLAGCLAKCREDRFANVDDLLQQLTLIYFEQFNEPPNSTPVAGDFTVIDYNNRGLSYHELQKYEAALIDFDQALNLDPSLAATYNNRGNAYTKLERYDEALADFDQSISLDPTLAQSYYNRGTTYYALQRYKEALGDYTKAIELDPTFAVAYSSRGLLHDSLRQYDKALADYAHAIQLDPTDAITYFNRGLTYYNLKLYEKSLEACTNAIQHDPTYAQAYLNRGLAYCGLCQYDKAFTDFAKAIELNPNDAKAYYNRGNTYHDRGQYNEALADYLQAIELAPNFAAAYANLGATYASLERYREALLYLTQSFRLDSNDAKAYFNRGIIFERLQRYDEALADYTHAIQLDPNYALALLNLGALLANRGALIEALPHFESAALLGLPQAAVYAVQARKMLETQPTLQLSPFQLAFEAVKYTGSFEEMKKVVTQFPFVAESRFIMSADWAITQQVASEHKPPFEQRLAWLLQIANEKARKEHNQ